MTRRRTFIYPHRSVRSVRITAAKLTVGLVASLLLSSLVAVSAIPLLSVHSRMSTSLLKLSGIPVSGMETLEIFRGLGPTVVPITPELDVKGSLIRAAILFIVCLVGLLVIQRRIQLSRTFIFFLITLLLLSGLAVAINPMFHLTSGEFSQIWLRGEILVWLILPWITTILFVSIQPSLLDGVLWVIGVQIYAFLWSAVRLTFCLGVLHYTGVLFLPLLWFCLGFLADFLYIQVFYSIVVHRSCNHWGQRATWQY